MQVNLTRPPSLLPSLPPFLPSRQLALKHHPDKNVGDEGATAVFQRLQEANSVLSDTRERAWYDSHRDEILRGDDDDDDDEEDDDDSGGRGGRKGGGGKKKRGKSSYVVNVMPFFSSSAFSGYGEGEGGFYAVYRGVFEKVDAREREGGMPAPPTARGGAAIGMGEAPGFGEPETGWGEVAAFYGYWGDFCSRLSFGWADEYREQDAPSRQVRRAMEKENRKSREAARRKYQDAIRALVDFVKKRDKRVMQRQVEVGREEAARAAAEVEGAKLKAEEFKKEKERWLKEQMQQWEEEEGARREEEGTVAFRLADEEEESSSSSEEGEEGGSRRWKPRKGKKKKKKNGGVFECVVCDKKFKSEKQLNNHKQSRAHRKMVEELQAEFGDLEGLQEEEEGEEEEVEEDEEGVGGEGEEEEEEEKEEEEVATEDGEGVEAMKDEDEDEGEGQGEEEAAAAEEEEEEQEEERQEQQDEQEEEEEEEEEESSSDEDVGHAARQVNRFAFADDSSSEED